MIKFIYSEKVVKFYKISTVDLSYAVTVQSTVEFLQNFVALSEYMNFNLIWTERITNTSLYDFNFQDTPSPGTGVLQLFQTWDVDKFVKMRRSQLFQTGLDQIGKVLSTYLCNHFKNLNIQFLRNYHGSHHLYQK